MHGRRPADRGAAAVELALVLPVLLVLVFGTVEFGRAYFVKNNMTAAAREGVRVMALRNDPAAARTTAINAAPVSPAVTASQVTISPASCTTGATVTLTITYQLTYVTGFFPGSPTITGTGVMRCGG